MHVEPLDPRDVSWELDRPAYRVVFWSPFAGGGWSSDTFEITGADVADVIAWAEERGDRYVLYVCTDNDDGKGLLRLAGTDPTRST